MNESPLPNVEAEIWTLENGQLYYIRDEKRYRVIEFKIVANGTRDLCVAIDSNGSPAIKKINEAEKTKILWTPNTDLLQVELDKPVHGQSRYMIIEITPEIKQLVDSVLKQGQIKIGKKGEDFDMHSGQNYQ